MTREAPAIAISYGVARGLVVLLVIAVLVLAAAIGVRQGLITMPSFFGGGLASQVDKSSYQAVFLTGGQVFFGKTQSVTDDYLALTDVFYLSPGSDQQASQLIKRGTELHGPQEPMIIPINSVLFVENLRTNSDVVTAITKFHAGQLPLATPAPTGVPTTAPTTRPSASPSASR